MAEPLRSSAVAPKIADNWVRNRSSATERAIIPSIVSIVVIADRGSADSIACLIIGIAAAASPRVLMM